MPDVNGLPISQARLALLRADLRNESVLLVEHPDPVEGIVVDQSPAPGDLARRGSIVTIYLEHPTAANDTGHSSR